MYMCLCQTKISDMVYYRELSQGQIIHKPNKEALSSMFTTHRLNVMHASANFHKYIPYGLRVMFVLRFYDPVNPMGYVECGQFT